MRIEVYDNVFELELLIVACFLVILAGTFFTYISYISNNEVGFVSFTIGTAAILSTLLVKYVVGLDYGKSK